MEIGIAGILAITLIIQLLYYIIYLRACFYQPAVTSSGREPVSVIICSRNAGEYLEKNLPLFLTQDYPNYEVVVVNDCSADHTADLLVQLKPQYPHLKFTTIEQDEKFSHGKKLAVTVGIKAASYEWLLFTDADCVPASPQWISTMQRNFTPEHSIVLGYGGYMSSPGLLNRLIRVDSMMIGLQYLGLAIAGMPYMGVGRNLAYRKSLFFSNKGFAKHTHILSGDDDLFVNETANAQNTAVELSAESITRSIPKKTFGDWFLQKRRHLTTSVYYTTTSKFTAGGEMLSRVIFYCALVWSLVYHNQLRNYIIIAAGIRFIIQGITYIFGSKKLNEKGIWHLAFICDILLPFMYFCAFIYNFFTTKRRR